MDLDNKPEKPDEEALFDDLLTAPELGEELGADEHAVSAAGLTHPDDAELERILTEAAQEDWSSSTRIVELGQSEAQAAPASGGGEASPADDSDDWIFNLPIDDFPEDALAPEAPFRDDEYRDTFGDGDAYSDLPEEPALPESADGQDAQPVRKGRPRRKKGSGLLGIPHILATVVWLAIAVAIGTAVGRMAWLCVSDVLAFGRADREVVFTVAEGDSVETIANKLKEAGLIRYPKLFQFYANLSHAEEDITPGTFTLNTRYDYHALVSFMNVEAVDHTVIEVVIPEGYNCAQIFSLLEEKGVCTAAELEEYCASGEFGDYWFLEGLPRSGKYALEGFLFPDTYQFYTYDDPDRVIEKFLANFEVRTTDEVDKYGESLRDKLDALNEWLAQKYAANGYDQEFIDAHRLTFRDAVIVASMIERESGGKDESADVASVIYNRLTNPANYPYLNIDATIVYALGGKEVLTEEDLLIDSPYNTYTHSGLTPGAISNPGKDSLRAALVPNDTNYYYYVLIPDTKTHRFFSSASEFNTYVDSIRGA